MNADHIGALVFFAVAIGLTVWGIHRRAQEHAFDQAVTDALNVTNPDPEPTSLFVDSYPDEAWDRLWEAIEQPPTADEPTPLYDQAVAKHKRQSAFVADASESLRQLFDRHGVTEDGAA